METLAEISVTNACQIGLEVIAIHQRKIFARTYCLSSISIICECIYDECSFRIKGPEVDCSSKWIFNLTLLHLPESTQKLDMAYNGLIKSGAFRRKISTLTKLDDICLRGNYIARFPFKMFDNQVDLKHTFLQIIIILAES